jgi:hypothetical protein
MFSWFKKKPPQEDWRLVKTMEGRQQWEKKDKSITEETIYYYLYESNFSNRKMEIKETGYCKEYNRGIEHPIYLSSIYPWLKGRNYKDIPTYWDERKNENEEYIRELYKRILNK